jgi:hypothetical protein
VYLEGKFSFTVKCITANTAHKLYSLFYHSLLPPYLPSPPAYPTLNVFYGIISIGTFFQRLNYRLQACSWLILITDHSKRIYRLSKRTEGRRTLGLKWTTRACNYNSIYGSTIQFSNLHPFPTLQLSSLGFNPTVKLTDNDGQKQYLY